MSNIEEIISVQGYKDLMDFIDRNPHFTNMQNSPSGEEWEEFFRGLKGFAYVRWILRRPYYLKAVDLLEKGYKKWRLETSLPQGDFSPEFINSKKLEREVRFLMRLSSLLGSPTGGFEYFFYNDQVDRLNGLKCELKGAGSKINMLLRDQSFRDAISTDKRVLRLQRLEKELNCVVDILDGLHINEDSYFLVRNTLKGGDGGRQSAMRSRDLLGRLADACFRLYGNCDSTILRNLNKFDWLPEINSRDIKHVMDRALNKKINEYAYQMTMQSEPGNWPTQNIQDPPLNWSVQRSITPPWMEA